MSPDSNINGSLSKLYETTISIDLPWQCTPCSIGSVRPVSPQYCATKPRSWLLSIPTLQKTSYLHCLLKEVIQGSQSSCFVLLQRALDRRTDSLVFGTDRLLLDKRNHALSLVYPCLDLPLDSLPHSWVVSQTSSPFDSGIPSPPAASGHGLLTRAWHVPRYRPMTGSKTSRKVTKGQGFTTKTGVDKGYFGQTLDTVFGQAGLALQYQSQVAIT